MLVQGASFAMLSAFGWLVVHFGAASFFLSTVLALIGMACVLVSLRLKPPKDAH